MRKIILSIVLLFSLSLWVYAQNFTPQKQNLIISGPQKSLKIGERLQYRLEWLGIPVGKIILNIIGIEKIEGNSCYHITAQAIPNKFFARLYDIEYSVHTYINTQTFDTQRFEKTRRIKDKFNYVVIDFDRQKKQVIYKSTGVTESKSISGVRDKMAKDIPATIKIINGTQDLLSSFYYIRLLEIKENASYSVNIYYDQRNWLLKMQVEEPFLKDIYKKGTFVVFGVTLDSDLSEFILGKRKIQVYSTADSRRIPLEFKFATSFGQLRGIIQDISN